MKDRVYKLFHKILEIKEKINFIKSEYKAKEITLVAVSKRKPLSDIELVMSINHNIFGENYAQELVEKYNNIKVKPEFHFIGPLQSKKVRMIIDKVVLIHSIDRIKVVKEIDKEAKKIDKVQNILIQLNLTNEETKSGIKKSEIYPFLEKAKEFDNVKIVGLMTMPFFTDDNELLRPYFRELRELRDELNINGYPDIKELSMGMSSDYPIAIEEGATIIRVGSSIFGERVTL